MPVPWIADDSFFRRTQRQPRSVGRGQRPASATSAAVNESPKIQANHEAAQDEFWHNHYHLESYYVNGRGYDQYRPAYELGWRAALQYPGDFASVMPVLEAQWQRHSGASLLDWRQVSSAVQAAWERMRHAGPTVSLSPLQLLALLQALQRLNQHTAKCLRLAVEQAPAGLLQQMLQRHVQGFDAAAAELKHEFALPAQDRDGRFSGPFQRGWESIKAMLGQPTMPSLMDASEDAERMLLQAYRGALRESLPEATRSVLQRQAMTVQRGIEALHWLRSCLPM
ncbi:MAG: hypothetical protein ABWY08_02980 [Comamonas sp.]